MKKLTLVLVAILFAVTGVLAQTPNEFKYQAVLRDASGVVMASEAVTVDISILQGSASGTSVFTEQHSVTTTAQGLINLNIGSVEDMSSVDWSSATYFIEISVNSTVMGTSQLLSVPYAMYAETSGAIAGGSTHYVGELYLGGIVYWVDATGEHGLIASLDDLDGGSGVAWSDVIDVVVPNGAQDFYNGASNTDAIIAQQTSTSAAQLCRTIGSDWYLPSHSELELLGDARVAINNILANDGNSATNGLNISNSSPYGYYWSSTENGNDYAWYLSLLYGNMSNGSKSNTCRVRAVRAF